jgi:hypothetical protein
MACGHSQLACKDELPASPLISTTRLADISDTAVCGAWDRKVISNSLLLFHLETVKRVKGLIIRQGNNLDSLRHTSLVLQWPEDRTFVAIGVHGAGFEKLLYNRAAVIGDRGNDMNAFVKALGVRADNPRTNPRCKLPMLSSTTSRISMLRHITISRPVVWYSVQVRLKVLCVFKLTVQIQAVLDDAMVVGCLRTF